jgi:antitoxin component YwqK of YwqJK toxin-antitoxin module
LEKKRRVIEWLQAVPGGERVTKVDENHIELKTWWPDNKYQFDEAPHLREMSIKWGPNGDNDHYHTRDGEYKEWYESGELRVHSYYKQGRIHGECKIWTKDGKIDSHVFFNRGEELNRIFFNAKPGYILVDGKYYSDD